MMSVWLGSILLVIGFSVLATLYVVIVFLLVFLALKFIEDVTRATTMILRFQPIATFLGILCIVQGILILLGNPLTFESIAGFLEPTA